MLSLLPAGLAAAGLQAQTADAPAAENPENQLIFLLLISSIVIALACLLLTFAVLVLIRHQVATTAEGAAEGQAVKTSEPLLSWSKIQAALTRAVPVEREADIDLGHDYDGIRELDNQLPPWWKYGFYVSIAFAAVYMYIYHWPGHDWSSIKEYEAEMAEAEIIKAKYQEKLAEGVNENSVTLLTDPASLENGKKIFTSLCAACHGMQGEGGIGPNLTDPYWLHGGSIKDVFSTIKYGVPEKGMISWQSQLKPNQMQEVGSYILSLQGTNPPNAKEPQGELYEPNSDQTEENETVGTH